MASGHVNRTKRPNTWLHRPACGREESPCQPGAAHTWHYAPQRSEVNSRNPHGWERWLTVALDNQEGGRDTGVVGGAIMGEILRAHRRRSSPTSTLLFSIAMMSSGWAV
jgi:hypothetical protein